MISRGSRGDLVSSTQALLRKVGVYDGRIDGWYGPKTEAAVSEWQTFLGAGKSGRWDGETNRRTLNFMTAINPDPLADPFVPGVTTSAG